MNTTAQRLLKNTISALFSTFDFEVFALKSTLVESCLAQKGDFCGVIHITTPRELLLVQKIKDPSLLSATVYVSTQSKSIYNLAVPLDLARPQGHIEPEEQTINKHNNITHIADRPNRKGMHSQAKNVLDNHHASNTILRLQAIFL